MAGARRFEDLLAWQLASELSEDVSTLTAKPRVARDRKFCEQIEAAAASPQLAKLLAARPRELCTDVTDHESITHALSKTVLATLSARLDRSGYIR